MFKKRPDAAGVLDHLHSSGDGGSLGGVEGGVNCVVQDTVGPVIAETFIIIVSTYVRMDCVTD